MHVSDIGHVAESAPRAGIIDQPVRNWADVEGQLAYGVLFTKWIAQDPSSLYWEVAENADNYACKSKSCTCGSILNCTDQYCKDFVTLNFMQKTLGYYLSDPQIQISPQNYQNNFGVRNITLESNNEDGGDDRCRWV